MTDTDLRELARLCSIQLTYEDAAGKTRKASRESLLAILRARIPDGMSFQEALRRRRQRRKPPVRVLWGDSELPYGYHTEGETALFVAPPRAPAAQSKTWGVFAPLYAMHTDRTWALGDLGDMRRYQQWVQEVGGSFVATLPLNAIEGDDPSPYAPTSRLYWNENYLDVTRLPEYRGEPLTPIPLERTIDYERAIAAKRALIEKLASRLRPDNEFREFALHAQEYAHFRGNADYHLYAQFRMSQQLRELPAMYLDFPLGVKADGFDATHFADHFAKGVSVGAPPDLVFTKGQNWGFPPLDPDAIRTRHHSYFRACISNALRHASILRIDHVMGLHRLFWIPAGGEPKDGLYVRYPADELYAILMIESDRSGSVVVGEDLGTVPQYVPQSMNRHGIRRMFVVQYELPKLEQPQRESIASINTHDMPTFAGFWDGKDIDERVEQKLLDQKAAVDEQRKRRRIRELVIKFLKARGLLGEGESAKMSVLEALLRWLGSSDAEFVLVNLEDCWLEQEPQNRPADPDRSWRQRMQKSLDEARSDAAVRHLLEAVRETRRGVDGKQT